MEVSRVWFLSGDTHICVFMSLYSQAHTQGLTDVYVKVQIVPQWLSGKESACQWGDTSLIPGSGRSPGEENGNPLQYSCLENSMDRGAWWAIVPGVKKTWTQLSVQTTTDASYFEGLGPDGVHLNYSLCCWSVNWKENQEKHNPRAVS